MEVLYSIKALDHHEYPENIQDFHDDMPPISDQMDGIDFILDPYIRPIRAREGNDDVLLDENITENEKTEAGLSPGKVQKNTLSGNSMIGPVNREMDIRRPYSDPRYVKIIKEINDNLLQKLNKLDSKHVYKKIPWKWLKAQDFTYWPNDVRFERVTHQGKRSLEKLYSNLDRMDFTKEFLDRWVVESNTETINLQGEITLNLLIKLNQGLNSNFQHIPWSDIGREDLVNWPDHVPVKRLIWMGKKQIKTLYQNLDSINFTQEFFDYWASKPSARVKDVKDGEITKNLLIKLNRGLNSNFRRIPWGKIRREDLVNWPDDVPVKSRILMTTKQIETLYQNLDAINFTQEFFNYWASKPSARVKDVKISIPQDPSVVSIDSVMVDGTQSNFSVQPIQGDQLVNQEKTDLQSEMAGDPEQIHRSEDGRQALIDKINRSLLSKLTVATGSRQTYIPWAKLIKGDLVNWPAKRMVRPSQFGLATLKSIDEWIDRIYFNPSAIERLQLVSSGYRPSKVLMNG